MYIHGIRSPKTLGFRVNIIRMVCWGPNSIIGSVYGPSGF